MCEGQERDLSINTVLFFPLFCELWETTATRVKVHHARIKFLRRIKVHMIILPQMKSFLHAGPILQRFPAGHGNQKTEIAGGGHYHSDITEVYSRLLWANRDDYLRGGGKRKHKLFAFALYEPLFPFPYGVQFKYRY